MTPSFTKQDGSALVTAILVSFLILTVGLSVAATVDTQQGQSRKQRERESTFQLSEGVLSAQIFQLSTRWPGADSTSTSEMYPSQCVPATADDDCPTPVAVTTSFQGVDQRSVTWTTKVRDNGGGAERFYDQSIVEGQPPYDRNNDDLMWVYAEAKLQDPSNAARFKSRAVVALIRAEKVPLNLPKATLVADHFKTTNQGNKTLIDTNGLKQEWSATAGPVYVRCQAPGFQALNQCASYDNTKQRKQLDPDTLQYTPPGTTNSLSQDKLDLLRTKAVSEGNYYASGCPSSLAGDESGETVFIEDMGAGCTFESNAVFNTEEKPGVVVFGKGPIELRGNMTFHGLLYHANFDDSTNDYLVHLNGNVSIIGSIQVSGRGGIYAGSSRVNLVYNPNYIEQIEAYGTAGIVQNSFREIQTSN